MIGSADQSIAGLAASHPCFTEGAGLLHGRIHLPVAACCNLGCDFCQRAVGIRAARLGGPGTARRVVRPAEAAARVDAVMERGPLHVVGIAGPGEPLANRETFETLRLVGARYPDLVLCLSTNGLLLADALPRLSRLNLRAVTVTINAVRSEVAARIYSWAHIEGKLLLGRDAAREILQRQWLGLARAVAAGLLVKVNSVLIPGVNDDHLPAVAQRAGELGAHRQNVMPLLPRGRMQQRRAPTRREVAYVQSQCGRWLRQFRGCTQCSADAIEMPPTGASGESICEAPACKEKEGASCVLATL